MLLDDTDFFDSTLFIFRIGLPFSALTCIFASRGSEAFRALQGRAM